jgi:hypothetical protein
MTAQTLPGNREKCLDARMAEYTSQPGAPAAFHEVLSQIGDSQRLRSINPVTAPADENGDIGIARDAETVPMSQPDVISSIQVQRAQEEAKTVENREQDRRRKHGGSAEVRGDLFGDAGGASPALY